VDRRRVVEVVDREAVDRREFEDCEVNPAVRSPRQTDRAVYMQHTAVSPLYGFFSGMAFASFPCWVST
jgi:hypothetical protein